MSRGKEKRPYSTNELHVTSETTTKSPKRPKTNSDTTESTQTSPGGQEYSGEMSSARWTALFRAHLEVLEAHVRTLEEVQRGVEREMVGLSAEEKVQWERGERGSWMVIEGMLGRAREVLGSARRAAEEVGGQAEREDVEKRHNTTTRIEERERVVESQSTQDADVDGDSDMSDATKTTKANQSDSQASKNDSTMTDSNAITPSKKRKSEMIQHDSSDARIKFPKKERKSTAPTGHSHENVQPDDLPVRRIPDIDFRAMEAKLQAEVQAGLQRQAEKAAEMEKENANSDKKKRKRSSVGGEGVVETKKVRQDDVGSASASSGKGESFPQRKIKETRKRKIETVVHASVLSDDGTKKLKKQHV